MISLTVNGTAYSYPQAGDLSWENGTNGPTEWASAVTTGMLSKAGGLFSLTALANFGPNFGIQTIAVTSGSTNPANSGILRLANTDAIGFRNAGNTVDILLQPDADGILQYGSVDLVNLSASQALTNKTISGASNTISNIALGSAVTGTLAIANGGTGLSSTSQNYGFFGPSSGSGAPTWRAIVAGDVPTLNQNTSGTAANVTGTSNSTLTSLSGLTTAASLATVGTIGTGVWQGTAIALNYGGTGQTTQQAALNALAPAAPTNGQVISYNGTNWVASTPAAGTKNYLTAIQTSNGTNTGNGNFEFGSLTGWNFCTTGTLTNGLPTSTPTFTSTTNTLYTFTISSNSATAGATYTNNSHTFTCVNTIASTTTVVMTGTGAPSSSGTLTYVTGGGGNTNNLAFSASTNEAVAIVSSGQLSGVYSASLASSGASVAGQGICSNAFYIDKEDQAKVLTVKFYYSVNSGASNANFSGTSSNSFAWAVYDVTNSAWLGTAGQFGMTQSSGTGYCTGTFQTASTTTQLQFVLYNANATTGATTIYIDDIFVGPQTAPSGPAMTDWVAYTPTFTGFGTVTGVSFYSRRVGKNLEVNGYFTAGTTTSTTAQITLGYNGANANVSFDSTATSNQNTVGYGATSTTPSTTFFGSITVLSPPSSTTYVNLGLQNSNTAAQNLINGNAFTTGSTTSLHFSIPIVGWSSNTSMSNDTDTRVVALSANNTSSSISGSMGNVVFSTTQADTHGAYNNSTGIYTVPVSGYYQVSSAILVNSGTIANGDIIQIQIVTAGPTIQGLVTRRFNTGDTNVTADITRVIYATAGTTFQIQALASTTTPTLVGGANSNYFQVTRVTGPAVVAATESVELIYNGYSSGITGTTNATVTYSTKVKDTHNGYSAGTYTVPVSGAYQVEAGLLLTSTGTPTVGTSIADIQIIQAGSASTTYEQKYYVPTTNTSIASAGFPISASGVMYCLAGDTIKVQGSVNLATAGCASSASMNYFNVYRVGN